MTQAAQSSGLSLEEARCLNMILNPNSPIPLYRQLAERLKGGISRGDYGVNTRIPSEHELSDHYCIGRPTVRQATDLLVRQGLLERRRGSGTFVLPPSQSIDLFSLAGTSAALKQSELDIELSVVLGPIAELSASLTGDNEVETLKIERRAVADQVVVLYETLWFDAEVFAGLEKHLPQHQSISNLVRQEYYLEPTSADQTFSVTLADQLQSGHLDVPESTPLLLVQRDLHFGELKNVLHADILCRTDCFEFSQTLYPAQSGAAHFGQA